MIHLSLTGVREIDAYLKGLPLVFQDKIMVQAHKEAAEPLVRAAQAFVKVKTRNLERSIGAVGLGSFSMKRTDQIGVVTVGPRRKGGFKGFHGHLVEFGTKPRYTKTGKYTGVMPKLPFMEPAFKATAKIVEGRIADSLGRKITAFTKKILKHG